MGGRALKDISGQKFGRLLVIGRAEKPKCGRGAYWQCVCDCGARGAFSGYYLRTGHTRSCGCLQREVCRDMGTAGASHGLSNTPTYKTWVSMKSRCYVPSSPSFKNYGARGIIVCERWLSDFDAFFADMGARPNGRSLDRIDVNGNYEPLNCRWATSEEQVSNRRNTRFVVVDGIKMRAAELAKMCGMRPTTFSRRIDAGWSVHKAMTTPAKAPDHLEAINCAN